MNPVDHPHGGVRIFRIYVMETEELTMDTG
jgi:ribosomal protein L2